MRILLRHPMALSPALGPAAPEPSFVWTIRPNEGASAAAYMNRGDEYHHLGQYGRAIEASSYIQPHRENCQNRRFIPQHFQGSSDS